VQLPQFQQARVQIDWFGKELILVLGEWPQPHVSVKMEIVPSCHFLWLSPKFALYKYVKLQGGWRYCKAAFHDNVKIKPNVLIDGKDKHEEKHSEGSYCLAHAGQWIPAGGNALEAQRRHKEQKSLAEYQRLSGNTSFSTCCHFQRLNLPGPFPQQPSLIFTQ
jgi:hypothetical protein